MPLTNSVYFTHAQSANLVKNWLFELDNSSGGTLRLAFGDTTVGGNVYHGAVLNRPSIRSSIDLAKSSGDTSNLSLEVANLKIAGVPLSESLVFGSVKYINRECRVYSQLNNDATLANCLRIYTGRLTSVVHDVGVIRLEFEEARPWDFLSIPDTKVTSGRYFPVVYGDFTANTSTPASPAYCASRALWPGEVDRVLSDGLHCLLPLAIASTAVRPHIYEAAANQFVPLVEDDGDYLASSVAVTGGNEAVVQPELVHAWKLKPVDHSSHLIFADTLTDPELSYDDDDADEAVTFGYASIDGTAHSIYYSIPQPVLSIWDTIDEVVQVKFFVRYYASRASSPYGPITLEGPTGTTLATYTPVTSPESGVLEFVVDATDLPGGVLPSQVGLVFTGGSVPTPITLRIYDFRLELHSRTDPATDATGLQRAKDQAQRIEKLYFGADGLTVSWGSAAVTEIHELHRDLLYRFAGYTTEPDGWSALDTARSGWTVRWWAHEPVSVKALLEQAQYEGGFIFLWAHDGTSRYLYVKSSYSGGDVTATLDPTDFKGLKVSHTDFGGLRTKKRILYDRHPATGDLQFTESYTNSSARTAYNIQTDENVEEVELEMLVANVDDHATYYGNIDGDIKAVVDLTITKPSRFNLTVGDIVQFDPAAMPVKAFSDAWTQYFMVTSCSRSVDDMKLTCVEVG